MQLTIDTNTDSPEMIRNVAAFLATFAGVPPQLEAPPPPQTYAYAEARDFPPPPPPSNVVPFPPAPQIADTVMSPPDASAIAIPATSTLDSAGLPWDARIHMDKKQQKKDGTWKIQKGCDPALVSAVVMELAASVPPPPTAVVPPPPPPAEPVAPAGMSFREFMDKIMGLTKEKKFAPIELPLILQPHGVPNLGSLMAMSHKIPEVNASLDAILAAR